MGQKHSAVLTGDRINEGFFFFARKCMAVLHILTLFQTKKCYFPHPLSNLASKLHTRFQTWRWSQNATLRRYIKQKLCHHC